MRRLSTSDPLLRHRDGRVFLASQALDALASGVAGVALPWLVLDAGGSVGEAGLVFTLTILPYVLFGLPAGVVGDRFPRRRVIWLAHAVQAAFAVIIPAWTVLGAPPLAVVLLAAFAIGAGRVFADAAAFGAVASLVGRDQFTSGQATLSAAWSLGLLAGPGLGGLLIHAIGPGRTLVIEAGAFLVAALLVVAVRSSFDADDPGAAVRPLAAMREGLAIIFRDPVIRALTFTALAGNTVLAGVYGLTVPMLRTEMGLSAREVGWVLALGAGMGVVAAPVVGRLERRIGGPRLLVYASFAHALLVLAFSLAYGLAAAALAYAFLNLVEWAMIAAFIGERQRRAPQHLQARVGISGRMISLGALAGGSALASRLTGVMSLRELYVAMSLAALVVAAVTAPIILRVARRQAVAER